MNCKDHYPYTILAKAHPHIVANGNLLSLLLQDLANLYCIYIVRKVGKKVIDGVYALSKNQKLTYNSLCNRLIEPQLPKIPTTRCVEGIQIGLNACTFLGGQAERHHICG